MCGGDSALPPPVAALSYRADFGAPAPGWCLRADPVHLRADSGGLVLFDAAAFALEAQESQALIATLAEHLRSDHWQLVSRHPQRWYLLGERAQRLVTPALPTVRAGRVGATPYGGEDAPQWMGRSNEMQMLLHSHSINRERAERGQAAVNSVWLWGESGAQRRPMPRYTQILADNTFARGLAVDAALADPQLPANARELFSAARPPADVLVVLEDCRDAAAYEDLEAWAAALARLERDWFAPLVAAVQRRQLDSILLYPLNGHCYRLTRRRLHAFWKGAGDYRTQTDFRRSSATRV